MVMSSPSFPLLRLPYVALKEVLCEAGPQEIFILSTCSQKSCRIIRSIKRPSQNWEIFFHRSSNTVGIQFENEYGESDSMFEVRVINTDEASKDQRNLEVTIIGKFKVLMGAKNDKVLRMYWDDEITGMKEVATYFTEIFHRPIYYLGIGENNQVPEDSKWIIDWINTRQKSVAELNYYTKCVANAEDVSYVFSNLKVDSRMLVILKFPDQLTRPEIRIAPMSMTSVEVNRSSWMTLEHILTIDCEDASFHTTNLSSQDLKNLLRHWKNGGFTRLEMFCIYTTEVFTYETVLEGMEFKKVPQNVVRQLSVDSKLQQICGGFDITRKSDGVMVTLIGKGSSRCFVLVKTSKLLVL